jgi:hypothetical protein
MSILKILLVMGISVGMLSGCATESESIFLVVNPEKGKALLEENEDIILIDVRTPEEYNGGHIPNSVNIPLDQIEKVIESEYDVDVPLMVVVSLVMEPYVNRLSRPVTK